MDNEKIKEEVLKEFSKPLNERYFNFIKDDLKKVLDLYSKKLFLKVSSKKEAIE